MFPLFFSPLENLISEVITDNEKTIFKIYYRQTNF